MLNSANSIHCGSIPLLVHESGPSSDNPGPSDSLGRVNLLDFLESVTVTNNAHFEIQEDDTPTVRQIKGLSKEVRDLRSELDGKNKLIESLRNPEPGGVAKGSSWRDKVASPECRQQVMHPSVGVDIPTAVAPQDDDARVEVMDSVAAEVIIDSEVLVNKEAMDIANVVTVSNSSKDIGASSLYAALPKELGVGMVDPDAVFQALMTASNDSINKLNNPGAAKRGRKPKNR
ncbi:hypothetical protein RHMOL_Rhmol12G0188600 [Rhododendron molle]|uniref:Uncharacterized protein n=1 Tax=Rhododendron molle TaxID=49168 RepID=A0ACC0LKW1_RHOML|nr:hypothetical protein RHMOL_Rhmol12G0188600 [Rhododendron molle]